MRGIESHVAAHRPDVALPSASARSAARRRLQEAITAEPPGVNAGAPITSARRPRASSWLVPALAVTIAITVAVIALVVPGHRHDNDTGRTAQPASRGAILALGGGPLPSDGSGLTAALRVEYRRQLAAGDTLRTSIDAGLQRVADTSLGHAERQFGGVRGTVVAMDPNTGAVMAMTSVSAAIGAGRQVGSVFDPFTALVAMQDGAWSPNQTYDDTGELCVMAHDPCRHNAGHIAGGVINVRRALSSEDELFVEHLGLLIRDRLAGRGVVSSMRRFGFGRRTGIDLPDESAGLLSGSTDPADAANDAIGLGPLAITPVQVAVAYSAIANADAFWKGGALVVPRVAEGVVDRAGHDHPPTLAVNLQSASLRGDALAAVRTGLRENATTSDGVGATASTFGSFPYAVHGLAGTVVSSGGGRQSDEAWYAGYVPAHGGRDSLVVVVAIPHAGFGAVAAAPVARQVFNAWETGRPGPWRPGDSRVH